MTHNPHHTANRDMTQKKKPHHSVGRKQELMRMVSPDAPSDISIGWTKVDKQVWDDYMSCRPTDEWTPSSLRAIADVVNIEQHMRAAQKVLRKEGLTQPSKAGLDIIHPMMTAYNRCIATRNAILRRINLDVMECTNPTEKNKAAKTMRTMRNTLSDGSTPAASLLAN